MLRMSCLLMTTAKSDSGDSGWWKGTTKGTSKMKKTSSVWICFSFQSTTPVIGFWFLWTWKHSILRAFDSLRGDSQGWHDDQCQKWMRIVASYVSMEYCFTKGNILTSEFTLTMVTNTPKQPNAHDCGVYCILFAEYELLMKPINFSSSLVTSGMRQRIAYYLATIQPGFIEWFK